MARLGRSSPIQTRILRRAAPLFPKTETLTDSFATLDTAKWTFTSGPVITGGKLDFPIQFDGNNPTALSVGSYDLGESYVFAKVEPPPLITLADSHFKIFHSISPVRSAGFTIAGGADPGILFFEYFDGSPSTASTSYDPVNHRWLRIRKVGTDILWDGSPSGLAGTWTNLRTRNATLSFASSRVQLDLMLYTAPGSLQHGYVDSLNIVPVATGRPKVYLAGSFQQKPAKVYMGSGPGFVEKPWKRWDGTAWKTLT